MIGSKTDSKHIMNLRAKTNMRDLHVPEPIICRECQPQSYNISMLTNHDLSPQVVLLLVMHNTIIGSTSSPAQCS